MSEDAIEEEWEYSAAKRLLLGDLRSGAIPLDSESMSPQVAYMQRPEYVESDPEYKRWASRLRSLREHVRDRNDRAASDSAALAHDRRIHPKPAFNHRGEPRWEGSDAERYLCQDMDAGKHENMTPMELHASRKEYRDDYPLGVFRQHIYQEKRRRKFAYYLKVKQQKKIDEKKKEREKKEQKKKEREKKEQEKKMKQQEMEQKRKEREEEKKRKLQEKEQKKKEREKKKEKEQKKKEREKTAQKKN